MTQVTDQLASRIIKEQELIIGPLAWDEAKKVPGLMLDIAQHAAHVEGDTPVVLGALVTRYERLFGKASREVCRDAVRPFLSQVPQEEIPAVLK